MKGMPVISDHRLPRTGRKIGTNPMGIATQHPMTKYVSIIDNLFHLLYPH